MAADPTATVPASQRLLTDPSMIGHVAPDFKDRKHFNTLVVRPEYRISLRLGSIEDLFADAPDSVAGRRARMQVLGMNYLPMNHPGGVSAHTVQWNFIKRGRSDADMDAEIQRLLREWVVAPTLPPPAEDPADPQTANFAKIRLPGAHTFFKPWGSMPSTLYRPDLLQPPPYPNVDVDDPVYDFETTIINENPVLTRLPLVALVEKRDPETAQWAPVPGALVCFQLVDPYDLPAYDPSVSAAEQFNRPPLRSTNMHHASGGGPAKLDTAQRNHSPTADDPQGKNAHHTRGGKRGRGSLSDGSDVADVIFRIQDTKGFNSAHSASRPLPHAPYPVAQRVNNAAHKHAVQAKTNADGEAGVIFTPSRCAGDKYRLRAYLADPRGQALVSDGTGMTGVSVETGTLVVWRHILVSQYLRQPEDSLHASVVNAWSSVPYSYADIDGHRLRCGCARRESGGGITHVGLNDLTLDGVGDDTTTFDGAKGQLAKAFCELEFGPGADTPVNITQADWNAAVTEARAAATRALNDLGVNYDLDALFFQDAGLTTSDVFCHMAMRPAKAYNDLLDAQTPPSGRQRIRYATNPATQPDPTLRFLPHSTDVSRLDTIIWDYCIPEFMKALTKGGVLPGITAVDGPFFCTWQLPGHVAANSGVAVHYRGFFVWCGKRTYRARTGMSNVPGGFPYDFTSNFLHELGHCLFRPHAKGNDPGQGEGGGANRDHHDKVADAICVMSYKTCEGQFCAKCLFSFAGWDRQQLPAST